MNFSQDQDSDNGDSLEVIHLSKKGKRVKHKRKKQFVSVARIAEPEVKDFDHKPGGPKIEIPPIDDLKLVSAIMNSQNNNDIDDTERSETPGLRLPGDGVENIDGKTGNQSRPNSAMKDKIEESEKIHHVGNEQVSNKTAKAVDHSSDIESIDNASDTAMPVEVSQHMGSGTVPSTAKTGTFLDQIEARVSDMVKTGEQIEQEELDDAQNNSATDSDKVFQYSQDNYGIVNEHTELYDGKAVSDETDSSNVPNIDSVHNSAIEEPSIYSRVEYSDSSDSEETESVSSAMRKNLSRASIQSNNSTQSHRSEVSTSSNFSQDLRSLRSTPGTGKETRRSSGIVSPCYESDSPFYGQSSNRNTPNLVSANQVRSQSVVSNSSANENVPSNLNTGSRPGSKVSSNGSAGFQEEEGRSSRLSQSSNHSASQDFEGECV